MGDMTSVLNENRSAVTDLLAAADRTGTAWTMAPAPGKWSPSQVVEHVARTLEEAGHVVAGTPVKGPALPAFVRPVLRMIFFNRIVSKGTFPKGYKAAKSMDPASGPATPADGRRRLEAALSTFDQACRAQAETGHAVASGIFGSVPVEDFAKFVALHTRHHVQQIAS
jgi:hypothetical protein